MYNMYNLKFLFPCNLISLYDLENGTVPIPSLNILFYKSSLWEFHKSYGCNETSLKLSRTISEEMCDGKDTGILHAVLLSK